jgi:hypothetical protein
MLLSQAYVCTNPRPCCPVCLAARLFIHHTTRRPMLSLSASPHAHLPVGLLLGCLCMLHEIQG